MIFLPVNGTRLLQMGDYRECLLRRRKLPFQTKLESAALSQEQPLASWRKAA
jgi:hypothetical protein